MIKLNNIKKNQTGSMLLTVIVLTSLFLIIFLGSISLGLLRIKLNKQNIAKDEATHIAEAGINYYRWILYHDEKHYFDTLSCGYDIDCDIGTSTYNDPFNPSGIKGKYHLTVHTPKKNGSSVITVTSVGWTDNYPEIKKTIEVKIGKKSWSAYSILSNSAIKINSNDEIYGKIHSNSGVRVDGIAHNIVSSSVKKYFDTEHCGAEEYGVHTHAYEISGGCNCPTSPNNCDPDEQYDDAQFIAGTMPNNYSNIFRAGRSFPSPTISFNIINDSISNMMELANTTDGDIIDSSLCSGDCDEGFQIILNNNNYSVNKVQTTNCDGTNPVTTSSLPGSPFTYPANGIILVKDRDKVWINDISINNSIENNRITILAFNGAIDQGNANIIINNNITYANNNGSEAIGLIAQNNIIVNHCFPNNTLQIDAAMISKKGKIRADNVNPIKNNLIINGSIATYDGFIFYNETTTTHWCWKFCCIWNCTNPCGAGTSCGWYDISEYYGFSNTEINYDPHLTYNPPPHFPTTGEYTFISWKEY